MQPEAEGSQVAEKKGPSASSWCTEVARGDQKRRKDHIVVGDALEGVVKHGNISGVKNARNVLGEKEAGPDFGHEAKKIAEEGIAWIVGTILADDAETLARGTAYEAG